MTTNEREKFQQIYGAGKLAMERGQYRQSIELLEAARELTSPNSRRGGEAAIWLVSAYQAADKIEEAIALAQELITHPNTQTREQAKRILYIMKAPKLERPAEWMSEIPDLAAERGESRYVTAKKTAPPVTQTELEDLEPPAVDTDNQFVWFALVLVVIIVGSLIWFGRV